MLRSFFQHFGKIPPSKMDHAEVAIDGQGDEEGNTGCSVETQNQEQCFTHNFIFALPQAFLVMVGLCGKTGHQQEISNNNIEKEETFVVPKHEAKGKVTEQLFVSLL